MFGWSLIRERHYRIKDFFEIIQSSRRNDNAVASATDVLGNSQEATSRIFLERQDECLPLDLHFFSFERFLG